jgi:hypothetical protein
MTPRFANRKFMFVVAVFFALSINNFSETLISHFDAKLFMAVKKKPISHIA